MNIRFSDTSSDNDARRALEKWAQSPERKYNIVHDIGGYDVELIGETKRVSAYASTLPRAVAAAFVEWEEGMGEPPRVPGWVCDMCDWKYNLRTDKNARKLALEFLYTAALAGSSGIPSPSSLDEKKRLQDLIDELAVSLVGGAPEGFFEFT